MTGFTIWLFWMIICVLGVLHILDQASALFLLTLVAIWWLGNLYKKVKKESEEIDKLLKDSTDLLEDSKDPV